MRVGHGAAGHGVLPHTADNIISAWGPTRDRCIAEAVAALVDSFADTAAAPARRLRSFAVPAGSDEAVLVAVLDEVLFVLDVHGYVPIATSLAAVARNRIDVTFTVTGTDDVEIIGSLPKGISFSDLEFGRHKGSWQCAVTVDV